MEIAIKILVSMVSFVFLNVIFALAYASPVDKNKNEKLEEIKQYVIYFGTVATVFYLIWTY